MDTNTSPLAPISGGALPVNEVWGLGRQGSAGDTWSQSINEDVNQEQGQPQDESAMTIVSARPTGEEANAWGAALAPAGMEGGSPTATLALSPARRWAAASESEGTSLPSPNLEGPGLGKRKRGS